MSEVKRFRADHRHVVETEFDDAQFVGVADFDRAIADRDAALGREAALQRCISTLELIINSGANQRDALQKRLTAADERADVLEGLLGNQVELLAAMFSSFDDKVYWLPVIVEECKKLRAALKPAEGCGDE